MPMHGMFMLASVGGKTKSNYGGTKLQIQKKKRRHAFEDCHIPAESVTK
jgi:hypothetical protein